ncbi:MAG: trypsin-like serine protease [Bdellovibrionota bacterium]
MWAPRAQALTDGHRIRLASSAAPYAAAVVLEANHRSCSAVRVASHTYLLAGHCLNGLKLRRSQKVRLLATNGKRFEHLRVTDSLLHPLYASPVRHPEREAIENYLNTTVDLGLVELEPLGKKDPAQPFLEAALGTALPEYKEADLGTSVIVVGGGCESVNPLSAQCEGKLSGNQGYLKAARRKLVRPKLKNMDLPTGQFYYATNSSAGRSLGPGDSGGPLLLPNGRVLGIHSLITAVQTEGEHTLPNYHVKLSHPAVASWLRLHLEKPVLLTAR